MLFFSLLLTCFALLAEGNFSVKKIHRTGNNVSLICMGDSGTERNARWSFNGTTLADSPCYGHSYYSDDSTLALIITPECEGIISCSSQNSVPDDSHGRPLYAYPVVTNDSVVVMTVRQGASVTLDCRMQISAQNNIIILWRFQSSCPKAYEALSNYSLVLNNVNSSHSGTYICRGTAMHYPANPFLIYDQHFVRKETVTRLEVKQFHPPTFPSNLTVMKMGDDLVVFNVEANGSAPISYQLLLDGAAYGKRETKEEGAARLTVNVSSLDIINEVAIVTVLATNVGWNHQTHEASISTVIVISQQGVPRTEPSILERCSLECIGGSGASGIMIILVFVVVVCLIIYCMKGRHSKKLQNTNLDYEMQGVSHVAQGEHASTKGGSAVLRSFNGTHSETHMSIHSNEVQSPSPLAIILENIAILMQLKEQEAELQLLTSLENIFTVILSKSAHSIILMVRIQEQVCGVLEEKREIVKRKKHAKEDNIEQCSAELGKLEKLAKMLNDWIKKHRTRHHSGSVSENHEVKTNMANLLNLLSHVIYVTRSPSHQFFTFLEEVIPLTLQGICMIDDRVIQQVVDLKEQLDKLSHSLCRGQAIEPHITQSIGNSTDTVSNWLQHYRRCL